MMNIIFSNHSIVSLMNYNFNKSFLTFYFYYFIGLLSWNAADCHVNLEEELSTITALALEGEEGKNGKIRLMLFSNFFFFTKNCQIYLRGK